MTDPIESAGEGGGRVTVGGRELSEYMDLPVLPVRGMTLFPQALMPLTLGRARSLRAMDSLGEDKLVVVVTQRDPSTEDPNLSDVYGVGTLAQVLRTGRVPQDENVIVAFVEGINRVRLLAELQREPYLRVRVRRLEDTLSVPTPELVGLERNVRDLFHEVVKNAPNMPDELLPLIHRIESAAALADFVAYSLPSLSNEVRQELLEAVDLRQRMRRLTELLIAERADQQLRDKIRDDVQETLGKRQREVVLREQLSAIRKELGDDEDGAREVSELRARLDEAGLPPEATKEAERELERLERIPSISPEYSVALTYVDWLASLPWKKSSGGGVDIERARQILDEDHFGLENVKERILEYLAVIQLKKDLRGPILCLVGPPGVGKTSVGRSIAHATGRQFVRLSLGGMQDEAEIRGHRRTYIGSMPGQIIQMIRRAGSNDPVFMLDEVDKLGKDFRGDPASALLEVLDPEQNFAFRDRYLDVPFDLSKVLFVTTANWLDPIPPPLRDRMEVTELPGYVDEEKREIARRYLIPKQAAAHGIPLGEAIEFPDDGIEEIIASYTHEAGVRLLEQKLAAICRKRARQIVAGAHDKLVVDTKVAHEMLGAPRYRIEREIAERTRQPGVAVALAWTPAGGDVLFVEATRMPRDRGEFSITGSVRKVMQESARAALSWLRANAARLGIDPAEFKAFDIHVHVPSGAIPKDGPSAGVVMVVALASLFTQRPVRPFVGMTGEITLSGMLLPVGGIKEKVLAAKRCGIREFILPEQNRPNVMEEIPEHLRQGLEFSFITSIDEVLERAFTEPLRLLAAPRAERGGWGGGDTARRAGPTVSARGIQEERR